MPLPRKKDQSVGLVLFSWLLLCGSSNDQRAKRVRAWCDKARQGDEVEVRMKDLKWIKFKIKDMRFVSDSHISNIFRNHLPRVTHQLNVVGKVASNHPGGSWILVEAEEISGH